MNLREPFTFNMAPAFAELMDRPDDERLAAYRDPAWRGRAWTSSTHRRQPLPAQLGRAHVGGDRRAHPELVDRDRRGARAPSAACTPLDVMLDISLEENLETRFRACSRTTTRRDRVAAPADGVLLGLADSGAHVSQLCDACLPTDLLGNWVREQGGHPARARGAQAHGRAGRGLRPAEAAACSRGMAADITVFDPDTVAPGPAAPDPRLPGRRRAPRRRRPGRHAPRPRERHRHPGRRAPDTPTGSAAPGPRAARVRRVRDHWAVRRLVVSGNRALHREAHAFVERDRRRVHGRGGIALTQVRPRAAASTKNSSYIRRARPTQRCACRRRRSRLHRPGLRPRQDRDKKTPPAPRWFRQPNSSRRSGRGTNRWRRVGNGTSPPVVDVR